MYPPSPRYVGDSLSELISRVEKAKKVVVFVNPTYEEIKKVLDCGADLIQLHGDENLEFAKKIGLKTCVCAPSPEKSAILAKFNPDYILIYLSDFAGFEKFYRHLPIAQRLKKLLNGKWEFKVIFEYEVFYPEDFIFKWLDKEFVIKLLILKRTPAK